MKLNNLNIFYIINFFNTNRQNQKSIIRILTLILSFKFLRNICTLIFNHVNLQCISTIS